MLPERTKERGLGIQFPKDWKLIDNSAGDVVALAVSPLNDAAKSCALVAIWKFDVPPETTVQSFLDQQLIGMQRRLINFELLSNGAFDLNGRRACRIECLHDNARTTKRDLAKFYVLLDGSYGWLIMCGTQRDDYNKYAKEIDAIIASFKLIEAK